MEVGLIGHEIAKQDARNEWLADWIRDREERAVISYIDSKRRPPGTVDPSKLLISPGQLIEVWEHSFDRFSAIGMTADFMTWPFPSFKSGFIFDQERES